MLLHLKPAECNGKGETVAQVLVNLPLKIDHCANVVEDVLSMIFQQIEKENILQVGDPGAKTNQEFFYWFGIVLYINKLFVINEKYNFLFNYL